MKQEKLQSIVESILFVSGEPIKKAKLAKVVGIELEALELVIAALLEKYAQSASGLTLLVKNDELQLASNPENISFVEQLMKAELQDSLSVPALEVVSIIAYRGPLSKAEIESIRGVNCNYTLRNLLLRGLIERSDNPRDSRGYVYSIAFEFLKKLGLSDVKKLPEYDILSVDERIDSVVLE